MATQPKQIVVVIEDEYNIRHLIEDVLGQNGFVVSSFDNAEAALKRIPSLSPSMIILDLQLPGISGLECCKRLRSDPAQKDIPVIFLSAHGSDVYKITALESGADDFMTKPFNNGELLARIRAVLRRSRSGGGSKSQAHRTLKDKSLVLDLESRSALLDAKTLTLTPKEFALLALFLRSDGRVLSRDALSTQVWEHENLPTSRTIDIHISRLRKKLGRFSKSIQTVGKVGYRYSAS